MLSLVYYNRIGKNAPCIMHGAFFSGAISGPVSSMDSAPANMQYRAGFTKIDVI